MRKIILLLLSVVTIFGCVSRKEFDTLNKNVENFEKRLAYLETQCKEINTNISSMRTIINAIQTDLYVTAIAPIKVDGKDVDMYLHSQMPTK